MFESFKAGLPPAASGQEAERAERRLATLKLAMQALQTLPADKSVERALRSVKRAIQEQEKWKAECERKQR